MKINYEINEEDYSKVVYGDSITGSMPIAVKWYYSDTIFFKRIDKLQDDETKWKPYIGFKLFDLFSKKEYCETNLEVITHKGWSKIKKIIRHKTNKKVYRIHTTSGIVEVTADHSLLDQNLKQIKPLDLQVGTTVLYTNDDIYLYDSNLIHFHEYSKPIFKTFLKAENALCFNHYCRNKNIDVRVIYKNGRYVVTDHFDPSLPKGLVTDVEMIEYDDYVYDIETQYGTFHAGAGSLIVKNTDSCMIELKTKSYEEFRKLNEKYSYFAELTDEMKQEISKLKTKVLEESFKEGKKLADEITDKLFKKPIELEFEKVYHPFIILSKKRYIGNYYGKTPYKIDKVEKKGIVLTRRDNPDIVKKVYEGVIEPLLNEGSRGVNLSVKFLKEQLRLLALNDVDLNDLVITKTLAKGYGKICEKCDGTGSINDSICKSCKEGIVYSNGDYKQLNSPHISLATKQRQRDRGSAPVVNDRISYVFVIKEDNPKAKLYERAEELSIVKEKGLKIDFMYYIENQLKNPICEVLTLAIDNPEQIFEEFSTKKKRVKKVKEDKNQPSILKWIGKK